MADDLGSLAGIKHHMGFFQRRFVIFEPPDLNDTAGKETVTACGVAAFDAGEFERHHFTIKGCQDGMQRAHPAHRIAGTPAHGFGPGEFGHHFGNDLG